MSGDPIVESSVGSSDPSSARANVQDVLPLLPNQLALLLFSERADVDPGFLQVRYRLEGPLDVSRYEQAWQAAIDRHPMLRSSIRPRPDGNPLAIVWRTAALAVQVEDWRSELDQEARLERLLESDRDQGLDLTVAPAMRLRLIRTKDEVYEAVWTCHHLYVDGWSSTIVLEDVMALYRDAPDGSVLPPAPPSDGLRSYVVWASGQEQDQLREYWSRTLSGYNGTPPLRIGSVDGQSGFGELTVEIAGGTAAAISSVASDLNVPSAILFQAAWALVLGLLTGEEDVAFGTTVSGRNADVPGMERLVGYFSNAVPVRVEIDRSAGLAAWLGDFRNRQFEMAQFEHASLADIHRWSDVPGHRAIFETFVVIENFLAGESTADGVVQSDFRSGLTTAYPITLAVGMATPWLLQLRFDRRRCSEEGARTLIDQLLRVLSDAVENPHERVGTLVDLAGDALSELVSLTEVERHVGPPVGERNRSDTERRLTTIWCRHLDLTDIGIDADYFDLGGTSLGAVRLFDSIKGEFGIDLPLSTLLTHPTIERLAQVIAGAEPGAAVDSKCLVPIQPNGTRAAIAAVHGGGGEVYIYRELAELLGADQPLYGLQPVGLDGVTKPLTSVPEMASRYVEELRQVQPEGPYRLIGFCFGGSVCLEMAAQLEDMGHEVDFIGVIDGGLPLDQARYETELERLKFLVQSRGLGGTARAALRHVRWRGEEWWKALIRRIKGEEQARHVAVAMANDRAFNLFEPRPSSAPITFIRSAEKQVGEGKDWDFAWDDYTPRLQAESVDALHQTLFEGSTVQALAAIIRRSIPD
jgi:thioesterase domain-containing protein/acyl carrier protein